MPDLIGLWYEDPIPKTMVLGTFPQITFDQLKEVEFVVPKEDFLNRFINETLKPTFDLIFNNEKEIESLSKIRDPLLPKFMSGEIDVDALMMEEEQRIENLETA